MEDVYKRQEVHCLSDGTFLRCYFTDVTIMILSGREKNMKIKKVQSVCLILACVVATGLIAVSYTHLLLSESCIRKMTVLRMP